MVIMIHEDALVCLILPHAQKKNKTTPSPNEQMAIPRFIWGEDKAS